MFRDGRRREWKVGRDELSFNRRFWLPRKIMSKEIDMDGTRIARELVGAARELTGAVGMDRGINPSKFWLVLHPTPDSEIGDVVWETDLHGFGLWARGGGPRFWLGVAAVKGDRGSAMRMGQELLDERDGIM